MKIVLRTVLLTFLFNVVLTVLVTLGFFLVLGNSIGIYLILVFCSFFTVAFSVLSWVLHVFSTEHKQILFLGLVFLSVLYLTISEFLQVVLFLVFASVNYFILFIVLPKLK